MLTTPIISSIAALARNYDALLCDAWGVIHDGVRLFDGAAEALVAFRRERGPVVILTNAPRPCSVIPAQLDRLGLPRTAYDAVVTSGDATRAEVEKRRGQNAFRIGPAKDEELYRDLAVRFTPLERADFIICSGLDDDSRDEPEQYRKLLPDARLEIVPGCGHAVDLEKPETLAELIQAGAEGTYAEDLEIDDRVLARRPWQADRLDRRHLEAAQRQSLGDLCRRCRDVDEVSNPRGQHTHRGA